MTAADMTTRSTFKIEDPSRGPGRVDFTAPDEGFGLLRPQNLRSGGTLPPKKGNLTGGPPLYRLHRARAGQPGPDMAIPSARAERARAVRMLGRSVVDGVYGKGFDTNTNRALVKG